ncbi:MAG: type I 3-dehydroquinate dehydratase [Syntrophobacteraceae bacterium]|nr:type I 3-dehydroquinate dehydratase [Syntrophobacteraceae bacterium]
MGCWSRLACLLLGSPWTYVQLPGQNAAAPGQLSLDDVKLLWHFFSSDEALKIVSGLQDMERQLQQADKLASIGQLASGIAHEINNPLSLILGYTQLLLRDEQEGSERAEDLRIIEKHARACKTIVKDLLSFAREAPSNKGSGHLHACIQEVLGVVRHQFELDGVHIESVFDEAMPSMTLDSSKIKQVVMNLIMNAKQAIKDKGEIRIVTRYDRQAGLGELRVRDTGCGIPSEQLPRIFDPFFTTKETGEGTGLGLSVSYGIVKDHGGEISVESEPGRGCTFTVSLPVVGDQQGTA